MRDAVTEEAILAIYRETIDALYGSVSRRCGGDRDLAEDVTQEAWTRAVESWRANGLPDRPLAWLRAVARNLLLNRLRRHAPLPLDAVRPDQIMVEVEHGAVADSAAAAAVVYRALHRLPPGRARLLESFHFDQLSMAEIAAARGLSVRAVEGRLRRARQSLRRELESILQAEGEIV